MHPIKFISPPLRRPAAPAVLLAALAAVFTAAAQDSDTAGSNATLSNLQPIDGIAAIVEEDIILKSELEENVLSATKTIAARGGQMPPESVIRKQVLDRLILQKLQVQRAESTGIRVSDADLDSTLERIAAQNNMTVAGLRERLEAENFAFGDFREEMRNELIVSRLRERVEASADAVSDTEVEILLASERYGGGEFKIAQVMIAVSEGATPDEVATARAKADDVVNRLNEGLDFAAAAVSYSDAPDALDGGEVGWRDVNSIPAMFADALEKLQPGQITPPIRSPAGFHILQLQDRRDKQPVVVNEVRAQQIFVAVTDLIDARSAMERIREVKTKLDEGEDFAKLARQYSDDLNSVHQGGDLGWFDPASRGDRFQEVIESLELGAYSEPFQTTMGWHIVKLNDRRNKDVTDLAQRMRAREIIRQQKAEEEYRRFLRQIRDESYIDVRIES